MYEYVEGKAMWANVSTPNTKFEPHKYSIVVLQILILLIS